MYICVFLCWVEKCVCVRFAGLKGVCVCVCAGLRGVCVCMCVFVLG